MNVNDLVFHLAIELKGLKKEELMVLLHKDLLEEPFADYRSDKRFVALVHNMHCEETDDGSCIALTIPNCTLKSWNFVENYNGKMQNVRNKD